MNICQASGDPIEDSHFNKGKNVSTCNNLFHSLFSNVELSLNGVYVTRSYNNYPYKAYIQNLLTYSHDVKENGFLRCEGWCSDELGKYENIEGNGVSTRHK